MYDYLANLSIGESCAVVYTEGRICVWTSTSELEDLLLRHCAFLVEYMSVPANRIVVVYSNFGVGKKIRKFLSKDASLSPLMLCHIVEVGSLVDYDYILVADAYNLELYGNTLLTRFCHSSNNISIWVDGNSAWKCPNLGLAAFFQDNRLDFEIFTGEKYTVADYLDLLHDGLVDLNHKREAERERQEQLAREQAERERQEQLAREQAERERQEQLAREQAERERQEQLAREQAERERQEQLAREQAERERQEQLAREQAERERQELHDAEVGEWSRDMVKNNSNGSSLEHGSLKTRGSSETEKSISQYGLKPLVIDEPQVTTKHETFEMLPQQNSLPHTEDGIDSILKDELDSYLKGLGNGCAYATVQDQGRVHVVVTSDDIKNKVALRYYAFLLGFLHVPAEDVAFVFVNQHLVYGTMQYFTMCYRRLNPNIMSLSEIDDGKSFRYLIVADLHNLKLTSLEKLKSLSGKCSNVYLCSIPAFMSMGQKALVDDYVRSLNPVMEIRTDSQYPLDDYISQNMSRWLQIRKEALWAEFGAAASTKSQAYFMNRKKTKNKSNSKPIKDVKMLPKGIASNDLEPQAKSENRQAVKKILKVATDVQIFRLNPYFAHYRKDWADVQERNERQWDAISNFAANLDLSSDDLVDKMNDAVVSGMVFFSKDFLSAVRAFKLCHEICPSKTLLLLRSLFDENISLSIRFKRYHIQVEQIRKIQIQRRASQPDAMVGQLQTLEAAANMLALAYPNKYYFFNLEYFVRFCRKAMFRMPGVWRFEEDYKDFVRICDRVRASLITYSDICEQKIGRHKSYAFDARLLTYDFICTVADIYH